MVSITEVEVIGARERVRRAVATVAQRVKAGECTVKGGCKDAGIQPLTYYRHLKKYRERVGGGPMATAHDAPVTTCAEAHATQSPQDSTPGGARGLI